MRRLKMSELQLIVFLLRIEALLIFFFQRGDGRLMVLMTSKKVFFFLVYLFQVGMDYVQTFEDLFYLVHQLLVIKLQLFIFLNCHTSIISLCQQHLLLIILIFLQLQNPLLHLCVFIYKEFEMFFQLDVLVFLDFQLSYDFFHLVLLGLGAGC